MKLINVCKTAKLGGMNFMLRKSVKVMFFISLLAIIIVCGDDETRAALKQKLKKV